MFRSSICPNPHVLGDSLTPCGLRMLRLSAICRRSLATAVILTGQLCPAQEALRNSLAGDAAAAARRLQPDSMPYTVKSGDLKLLITPSLGLDWNDNINISTSDAQKDFVLHPLLQLSASYPLTQRNLLELNVGIGYQKYFHHDELSTWSLQSGSGLSFDISVKDFLINLHDRLSFSRDSATEAAVAGTAQFGLINNAAGVLITWDLEDVTFSLGYDHANYISPATQFQSQDRASELFTARVGLKLNPRLTIGVETTAAFTAYDQLVLNNNSSFSAGVYADWQPGSYFRFQPHAGYTVTQFQHTSRSIETTDLGSWYADLTVDHRITEGVSYLLSAGHEVRAGIQSDAVQDWYVRPSVDWKVVKNLSLQTFLTFEHGASGAGNVRGNLTETYDYIGGGLNLSHAITDRFSLALSYRRTIRSSSTSGRGYTQNVAGLQISYRYQ